jgi:FkbM family methyltransferase
MKQHIDSNTVILDIGSNVGNHAIYFSKNTQAKTIYVVEPIPRTYKMLLANLALNYCHNVNVDFIGVALGDRECIGYPCLIYGKDNLGSATIGPVPYQDRNDNILDPVNVVVGDTLFQDIDINFIKMDVERMEMVALAGLSNTISRCRPKMFIEISAENDQDFKKWVEDNNYLIDSTHDKRSTPIYANYFVVPK